MFRTLMPIVFLVLLCSCASVKVNKQGVITELPPDSVSEEDILGKWGKTSKGIKARIIGFYALLTRDENCVIEFNNTTKKKIYLLLDEHTFKSNHNVMQTYDTIGKKWFYLAASREEEQYHPVLVPPEKSVFVRVWRRTFYWGQPKPCNKKQYRYHINDVWYFKEEELKRFNRDCGGKLCLATIETAPVIVDPNKIKYLNSSVGPKLFAFPDSEGIKLINENIKNNVKYDKPSQRAPDDIIFLR